MMSVTGLVDGRDLTDDFTARAGMWSLWFESVGCCQDGASYTLDPGGIELLTPRRSETSRYFPRTSLEWAVSLESPWQPHAVTPRFHFEGDRGEVLVLDFHDGDLRGFGLDFYADMGFRMKLKRAEWHLESDGILEEW